MASSRGPKKHRVSKKLAPVSHNVKKKKTSKNKKEMAYLHGKNLVGKEIKSVKLFFREAQSTISDHGCLKTSKKQFSHLLNDDLDKENQHCQFYRTVVKKKVSDRHLRKKIFDDCCQNSRQDCKALEHANEVHAETTMMETGTELEEDIRLVPGSGRNEGFDGANILKEKEVDDGSIDTEELITNRYATVASRDNVDGSIFCDLNKIEDEILEEPVTSSDTVESIECPGKTSNILKNGSFNLTKETGSELDGNDYSVPGSVCNDSSHEKYLGNVSRDDDDAELNKNGHINVQGKNRSSCTPTEGFSNRNLDINEQEIDEPMIPTDTCEGPECPVKASNIANNGSINLDVDKKDGANVGIYTGSIQNVYFVGKSESHNWEKDSRTMYVLSEEYPALCFKIQHECNIGHLYENCRRVWNLEDVVFDDTAMYCVKSENEKVCRMVDNSESTLTFNDKTTFIFSKLLAQPITLKHSGVLWTCGNCFKGNSYRGNLLKHLNKEGHTMMFSGNLPPCNWGHSKTKSKSKCWAEPTQFSKMHPFVNGVRSTDKTIATSNYKPIKCKSKTVKPLLDSTVGSRVDIDLEDLLCLVCDKKVGHNHFERHIKDHGLSVNAYNKHFGLSATSPTVPLEKVNEEQGGEGLRQSYFTCMICNDVVQHDNMECHLQDEHAWSQAEYFNFFGKAGNDNGKSHEMVNQEKENEEITGCKLVDVQDKSSNICSTSQSEGLLRKSSRISRKPPTNMAEIEEGSEKDISSGSEGSVWNMPQDRVNNSDVEYSDSASDKDVPNKVLKTPNGIKKKKQLQTSDNDPILESNKTARFQKMFDILRSRCERQTFILDAEDEEFEKKLLIIPTSTGSKKYQSKKKKIPAPVKTKLLGGDILTGVDSIFQTSAVNDKKHYMRRLMGDLQAEINLLFPDKLPDGRLIYQYFLDFREQHWIHPMNVLHLIEKYVSPSAKSKMYSAINTVYDEILNYAELPAGMAQFMKPQSNEAISEDEARKRIKEFITDVKILRDSMNRTKPYSRWKAEQDENTLITRDGKKLFEKVFIPDPKLVVHQYLQSEYSKTIEDDLIRLASDPSRPVEWAVLKRITDHILIRFGLKGGNRTEAYGKLRRGDLIKALKKGFSAFPFKPLDLTEKVPDENLEDGNYVSNNPWLEDPNDPDPDQQNPNWNRLKGYSLQLDFHKTLGKSPVVIWLSQVDMLLLKCYEECSNRYLKANKIDVTINTPLFVNSIGGFYVGSKTNSVDFAKFLEITGLVHMTFYVMRRMFINFAWSQKDATLKECAAWAANHTLDTAVTHYVNEAAHIDMSNIITAAYRSVMSLAEESIDQDISGTRLKVNDEQDERFHDMNDDVIESELEEYLAIQSDRYNQVKPSLHRVMTEKAKCALIDLICTAHENKICPTGVEVGYILLGDKGKLSFDCQQLILKLLDTVPRSWKCVDDLLENFFLYGELLSESYSDPTLQDLLKIENAWVNKLVNILQALGKEKTTANSRLLKRLYDFANHVGSLEFTFGSKRLRHQVKNFMPHKTLQLKGTSEENTVNPIEYMETIHQRISKIKEATGSSVTKTLKIMEEDDTRSLKSMNHKVIDDSDAASLITASVCDTESTTAAAFENVEFETEEVVLSLPESPFKMKVRIGSEVVESTDNIQISEIHKVSKKVLKNSHGTIMFTDPMKRSLLQLYIIYAKNPLADRKADMTRECQYIYDKKSIDVNGDLIRINQIAKSSATLGDIMHRRFSRGMDKGGLSFPIFEVKYPFLDFILKI